MFDPQENTSEKLPTGTPGVHVFHGYAQNMAGLLGKYPKSSLKAVQVISLNRTSLLPTISYCKFSYRNTSEMRTAMIMQ